MMQSYYFFSISWHHSPSQNVPLMKKICCKVSWFRRAVSKKIAH